MIEKMNIRDLVRQRYAKIAEGDASCCGPCGCTPTPGDVAEHIGYSDEDLAAAPKGSNLGLGCAAPLKEAGVRPGETVLDLGSGAGFDAFLASREVGPEGRVIGVDMTDEMLAKARANAEKAGIANVEFRKGKIEALPVEDQSVDVMISNCVINLSPDKPRVFREAFRALRPGGRVAFSDLVLVSDLPVAARESIEAWVGCVAGALPLPEFLAGLEEAGFEEVEVVSEARYDVEAVPTGLSGALEAVRSVTVRAVRP